MTPRRPGASRSSSSRSGGRRGRRGSGSRPERGGERGADTTPSGSLPAVGGEEADTGIERTVPPRVITLVVVSLIAFAVVFTSLRAYLAQQAQYDAVVDQIAEAKATSTMLEEELALWEDDDYVRAQVRERLGYVMPGETSYVVVGAEEFEDGQGGAASAGEDSRPPWYETLRESVRATGEGEEAR